MEYSKHNLFSRIAGSDEYFLINPLSRQADILDAEEANAYREGRARSDPEYARKGYVVDPEEEDRRYRQAYLDFLDERDKEEVQLFFAPWYACNFNCSYCFQDEYDPGRGKLDRDVVDAFYAYVDREFAGRRVYLTLFGGEPLLGSQVHRESIRTLLDGARARNLDVALVTNGYHLADSLDLFEGVRVREVQVTLDGTREVHDKRRMRKDGSGSFDRIVEGVDAALSRGIPVNLRAVVDRDNLWDLPALAQFAEDRGWNRHPLFKTALGRNYELHHCQTNRGRLFSRIELYAELYALVKEHPGILDFHKPAFSIARYLFEQGEMPGPLFDSCSGTKTEWAFDFQGNIYACTATVGNAGDALGTFYPRVERNEDAIEAWEDRDVMAIGQCRDCSLQLACGGGCAAVARTNQGSSLRPTAGPSWSCWSWGSDCTATFPWLRLFVRQ
ncbi:MAG: radical SAM protein [Bacteroidales bacterium]